MNEIALKPDATTLVNVLTCEPTDQEALLALLRDNIDKVISTLDGWIATNLVAAADGSRVVIISQWRDAAAVKAMQTNERMVAYFPKLAALARFDATVGAIAYQRAA